MKISQNLSSASLFHFTSQLDYLVSIIEYGFQARYCIEKLPKTRLAYLSPMVCFCDIPLGSIKFHLSRYGGYGIGLKKTFLKKQGASPLLYVHSNSPHISITGSEKNMTDLKKSPFTPYLKQVTGYDPVFKADTRLVEKTRKVNYMNEKEWRYIPENVELEFVKYSSNQQLVDIKDKKNGTNTFDLLTINNLDNIEYVLLGRNTDIKPFLKFLDELSKKRSFDKELLISKILTQGQILRDF